MDLITINYFIIFFKFVCVFLFLNGRNEKTYKWSDLNRGERIVLIPTFIDTMLEYLFCS